MIRKACRLECSDKGRDKPVPAGQTRASTRPRMLSGSGRELLQNFSTQLLGFREKFLVFREQPVQFERFFGFQPMPQEHVSNVDRIRQQRFFFDLFKGGGWVVVIHVNILVFFEFIFPRPSE